MLNRISIVFIVSMTLLFGCTNKSAQSDSVPADFTLQDIGGKNVKLSDYKGKVVLIEFWATWCPPCRASVPGLEKLHKTYRDRGLVVLAVSMDEGGWDVVQSFVKENGITYAVLKGTEDVAAQYQVRSIPMVVVVNREGRISKQYLGFGNDDELEKEIKTFL